MMTSLFSSFDPSTSNLIQLNWLSSMCILLLMPLTYWATPSSYSKMHSHTHKWIHQELKMNFSIKDTGSTLIMSSLFMIILLNNLGGLLPYMFTSTSHIILPLSFSLPLWLSFMLFKWVRKTNATFAHLVPEGTPLTLMPFSVMIETLSNLIRPGVVALRLTANMMAGHILVTLLGSISPKLENYNFIFMIPLQSSLLVFELGVTIIQAYVFSLLLSLYLSE